MHADWAIDIVRQNSEQAQARAERIGMHLSALRAACRRASGWRGLIRGCVRV
jgi:hypothetical protein